MEYVKCDLCGSDDTVIIAKRARFLKLNNVVCRKCGLVYINPRPENDDIKKYYTSESYRKQFHKNNYKQESYEYASIWETTQRVNFLKTNIGIDNFGIKNKSIMASVPLKNKTILDVGCNTGRVLNCFKQMGWKELGIEPTQAIVECAKKEFGINILPGFANQIKNQRFDIITYFHVLEHVASPTSEMKLARNLLNDDGVILIFVPDILKPEGKFEHFLQHPHIYHFCPRTLELVMKKVGFKLVHLDHDKKGIRSIFVKAPPEKLDLSKESTSQIIIDFVKKYKKAYYLKGKFVSHHSRMAYHKLSPKIIRLIMKLFGKKSPQIINRIKKIKDRL